MRNYNKMPNMNIRYNLLIVIVYIIGIILLMQLFNLQIVHGEEYRQESNTRLTRENILKAARGNILDTSGNVIATTKSTYTLVLYKSKIDVDTLNSTLLNIVALLEKNGDSYVKNFPVDLETMTHRFSTEEKFIEWKNSNKINEQSTPEQCIYFFKDKYKIQEENLEHLYKIINLRYEIETKGYSSTKSIEISSKISEGTLNEILEKGQYYPGVNIETKVTRQYINGSLASHILGYTGSISEEELKTRKDRYKNNDEIGKTGIEYVLEDYLKGTDGIKQVDMSVDGAVTGEYIQTEAISGADVILTIDANLQKVTEQALKDNIEKIRNGQFGTKYDAKSGAVVVMKVKTGEVLAMASYPDYNPQIIADGMTREQYVELFQTTNGPLFNRAIQGTYAPGSIFKMVTATAALETSAIDASTKILTQGVYNKAHRPACWLWNQSRGSHGWINISQAIQRSCNYFFYEMGNRVGIDNIERYARYYGLGIKTGIELPNEAAGVVPSRTIAEEKGTEWQLGETLSVAIGQSYNNYTPIQIAKYISTIANGGKAVNPTIIKSIIKADGTSISKEEINIEVNKKLGRAYEQIDIEVNPENIQTILKGMNLVTEAGGTAYSTFANFPIKVGGKTGSAQAGTFTNAWFVGITPFDDPEITVVVLVENGGNGSYTAPLAKEIMTQYFGMNTNQVTEDMTAIPYIELLR